MQHVHVVCRIICSCQPQQGDWCYWGCGSGGTLGCLPIGKWWGNILRQDYPTASIKAWVCERGWSKCAHLKTDLHTRCLSCKSQYSVSGCGSEHRACCLLTGRSELQSLAVCSRYWNPNCIHASKCGILKKEKEQQTCLQSTQYSTQWKCDCSAKVPRVVSKDKGRCWDREDDEGGGGGGGAAGSAWLRLTQRSGRAAAWHTHNTRVYTKMTKSRFSVTQREDRNLCIHGKHVTSCYLLNSCWVTAAVTGMREGL